jgi:hypothetical protein
MVRPSPEDREAGDAAKALSTGAVAPPLVLCANPTFENFAGRAPQLEA